MDQAGRIVGHIYRQPGTFEIAVQASTPDGQTELSATVVVSQTPPNLGSATTLIQVRDGLGGPMGGEVLATTDAVGEATLDVARGVRRQLVFNRGGWFEQRHALEIPVDADAWRAEVTMLQAGPTEVLADAEDGGALSTPDGVGLRFGPGAFVDADGAPLQGEVAVTVTVIHPSGPDGSAVPSGYQAFASAEGGAQPLFGHEVVGVELRQGGRPVQLADGQTATLDIPVSEAPAEPNVPLYRLDESTGFWVEEGSASYVEEGGQRVLRAEVSHFSWFMPGFGGVAQFVDVQLTDGGAPLVLDERAVLRTSFFGRMDGATCRGVFTRILSELPNPLGFPLPAVDNLRLEVLLDARFVGRRVVDASAALGTIEIPVFNTQDPEPERRTVLDPAGFGQHDYAEAGPHVFTFEAMQGQRYELTITSDMQDGFAYVTSPSGELVTTQLFSSREPQALQLFTLEAGRYATVVDARGPGSLTVRARLIEADLLEIDRSYDIDVTEGLRVLCAAAIGRPVGPGTPDLQTHAGQRPSANLYRARVGRVPRFVPP